MIAPMIPLTVSATTLPAPAAATPADWALLGVFVGGALSISFLCSILEATFLSVRVPSLMERRERGDRGAAKLLALKEERVDDAISSILTLNTIAHTVGATLAGAQAAICFGEAWLGVFSGVLTLLVLVVTEIIPKTIGTVYANRLVGFVGAAIGVLVKVLAPILFVTRALTKLFSRGHSETVSRGELAALVSLAAGQGEIERDESRVLANVLKFEKVRVEDVMTPRTVTTMLPVAATVGDLLAYAGATSYSRVPLYDGDRDHVTGYVLLREALVAASRGGDVKQPLSDFRRDVLFLPESAPLADAMRKMLGRREHLAVAVDEFGGTSGLITLEDIVETILGVEIVDESDRVADMRQLAAELRDKRLKRQDEAE